MKILALVSLSLVSMGLAQTNLVTLRDNREHAFSIDVPRNWSVHGGMFRLGIIDSRPVVVMTSPDGKSNIQIGDQMIPAYSLPSPQFQRFGFTEGKVMPVLGSWPIVARFRPADEYVAKYGVAHFGTMCKSPEVKKVTSVPNRIVKKPYPGGQLTAAEGYFTCTANNQEMLGYVYAETYSAPGAGGLWAVDAIGSFLAPVAQAQQVGEVLAQSWKTFVFNPQWTRAQSALVQMIAQKSSEDLQTHLKVSQAKFEQTMNAIHQQGDTFSDVLNGTTVTKDASGQIHEVATGTGGQKWMNGQNVVIESALSPGPGFQPLTPVGH
jgi:hypothetical protein